MRLLSLFAGSGTGDMSYFAGVVPVRHEAAPTPILADNDGQHAHETSAFPLPTNTGSPRSSARHAGLKRRCTAISATP